MNDDRYLMHYGVKGMKWGVRKDRPSEGRRVSAKDAAKTAFKITHPVTYSLAKKAKNSSKLKNAANYRRNITGSRKSNALKAARRKNINNMSNQELNDTIYRLNLERNYRSLTRWDTNRGRNRANDIINHDKAYKDLKKTAAYEVGKRVVKAAATKH